MATISPTYSPKSNRPGYNDQGNPFDPESARDRYAENVYFQDGAVFTGILTSLLYVILATSLDAAGYVQNMTLLVPVVFGALGLAFLMAYSRFDGFFALSHSLFTCLAWILYLMTSIVSTAEIRPFLDNGIPELQAKAYFVLLRWLNWIDAAISGVASEDNYIFIFEMAFLVWWLTYLGVWSIFRYGYTWRAIIPAGVVLLINVYYAPNSILGFLVIFCLIAILLFVRTHLAEQQLRWREQRIYFSQDISLDFLRNGFMYAIVVLALAMIAPGLGRSLQVRTVMAPINERWEAATERWAQLYQGVNRQLQPGTAGFGRSLSLGGERNVGNSFVFRVSSPIGRYWRAVVYDSYTGRQWLNTYEDEVEFSANENVPIANWSMRSPMTQTVTLMAPSGNVIFSAPDVVRVDLPISAVVSPVPGFGDSDGAVDGAMDDGSDFGGPVEVTWARTRQMLASGDSYQVVSNFSQTTVRGLNEASTDYPQSIIDNYLQLPENFSARVAAHAEELTAEHETPYQKSKAIETFLRGYTYNDIIAAPPPDVDPVEYFLYDIQEGYCDYYATSMAVMLRSVGVPARVVSGYAQGVLDEESGQYYISERDAHTWVEVYFPQYGWIEFEPTAGQAPLDRPAGDDPMDADVFADHDHQDFSNEGPLPEDEWLHQPNDGPIPDWLEQEEQFLEYGSIGEAPQEDRFPWVLLTPFILIAGVWVIWRTRIQGPDQFDPDLPTILYDRLQTWAARLGFRVQASHTPYEQAHRFTRALPEARTPIRSITDSYVQYRFNRAGRESERASHEQPREQPDEQPREEFGAPHESQMAAGQVREGYVTEGSTPGGPLSAWKDLQPILWRAWFRKIFGRVSLPGTSEGKKDNRQQGAYTLQANDSRPEHKITEQEEREQRYRPKYKNGNLANTESSYSSRKVNPSRPGANGYR